MGSFVGIFLEDLSDFKVIKSTNFSFLQHETYSWEVEDDKFVLSDELSGGVKHFDKTVRTWMNDLNIEQRKLFVDTMYSIICASNATKVTDFAKMALKERENLMDLPLLHWV